MESFDRKIDLFLFFQSEFVYQDFVSAINRFHMTAACHLDFLFSVCLPNLKEILPIGSGSILRKCTLSILQFCTFKALHINVKSPGLVVTGDDSCSRGRGFESLHHILNGHDIFSH